MTHNVETLPADHCVSVNGQLILQAIQEILLSRVVVDTDFILTEACAQSVGSAHLMVTKASEASGKLPHALELHLAQALNLAPRKSECFVSLLNSVTAILPRANWVKREAKPGQDSSFVEKHRHAIITGVGGVFECNTLTMGLALMAPFTSYPFHHHPPGEFYIVLSEGEWYREDLGWWSPGVGGVVLNPPSCVHAMRSMDVPLLALWGLIH
jgi:hypothetical protein